MDIGVFGRILITIAVGLLVMGVLFILFAKLTGGRGLPGDIVWRRDGTTIYFPIVTSILISIVLTLILS